MKGGSFIMKEDLRYGIIVALIIHILGGIFLIGLALRFYSHSQPDILLGLETTINWWIYMLTYVGASAYFFHQKKKIYIVAAIIWLLLVQGVAGTLVALIFATSYIYLCFYRR